jgi:cytochrome c oxidase subunit III
MSDEVAPHVHFQYSDARHQTETSIIGMWLFLGTEVLFFGGLILVWIFCRHWQQAGFDAGSRETVLWIGTVNLALLLTSSLVYALGQATIDAGRPRQLSWFALATAAIGVAFLALKVLEWSIDLDEHLFPAGPFKLHGTVEGGARLFWTFYFVATGLHAAHMIVGVGLVLWIVLLARRGAFDRNWHTPVTVVGLYWSFVDIVWVVLYPLIYLIGRR